MPDLPMTVSLNSLPILILCETTVENPTNGELHIEQVPYQSLFRPDRSGRILAGTLFGCVEPFKIALRGVNQVGKCGVTVIHAPYDDVVLPIEAENPPIWMAITNYDSDPAQTVCYIPTKNRPLMTFNDIFMQDFKNGAPNSTFEEHAENMNSDMFHVVLVDYSRTRSPGGTTYPNLQSFRAATREYEGHAFDMFHQAA